MIAQIGSINVKEAEELAHLATALGYDAVSAVTPKKPNTGSSSSPSRLDKINET